MEIKAIGEQKSLLAQLTPGKRTRLRRLLYEFGPGSGTLLFLPIDQGIEHGPRAFFPNPASKDPEYQFRLAAEAGYSAIACGYGMASKYYPSYAGQVPLLLKLNSKTDIPPADEAFSACNATVEDGVRLGADAIGYAARVAMEMGADVVKLNMPKLNPDKDKDAPAPYNEMEITQAEAIRHCVESAGKALVVLSGGSKVDDDKLLAQTR